MTGDPTPWRTYVEQRLAVLAGLQADWDGYGASAIAPEAINRARDLLGVIEVLALAFPQITCPSIVPTADGGVDLEWCPVGGAWVSIEASADGQPWAIGHNADRSVELSYGDEDDEPAAGGMPTEQRLAELVAEAEAGYDVSQLRQRPARADESG